MFNWSTILPQPNNNYSGSKISLYYLVLLACMFTFRGCVHYFAPDGGSGIIAGIPLETYPAGAVQAIINHSGVFGIGHLIEASLTWFVVFRYRSLIPFLLSFVLVTQVLGIILFLWKPLPSWILKSILWVSLLSTSPWLWEYTLISGCKAVNFFNNTFISNILGLMVMMVVVLS